MPLVFAGVCSHAPGITGPRRPGRPRRRDDFYAALDGMREALEASRPDALVVDRGRALRQLLHGQHAELRHRHGRLVRRSDRGSRLARHRQGHGAGRPRPSEAADHARDADAADVAYARGVALRPRDHGPAAFPDPSLRPPDHPGQHQLPGPTAGPAAPRLDVRRVAASRRRRRRPSASPSSAPEDLPLAGDARLREDQRGVGPRLPRPLVPQRPRGAAGLRRSRVYADAGQGGFEIRTFVAVSGAAGGATRHGALLRADPDLRRRLHRGPR